MSLLLWLLRTAQEESGKSNRRTPWDSLCCCSSSYRVCLHLFGHFQIRSFFHVFFGLLPLLVCQLSSLGRLLCRTFSGVMRNLGTESLPKSGAPDCSTATAPQPRQPRQHSMSGRQSPIDMQHCAKLRGHSRSHLVGAADRGSGWYPLET